MRTFPPEWAIPAAKKKKRKKNKRKQKLGNARQKRCHFKEWRLMEWKNGNEHKTTNKSKWASVLPRGKDDEWNEERGKTGKGKKERTGRRRGKPDIRTETGI